MFFDTFFYQSIVSSFTSLHFLLWIPSWVIKYELYNSSNIILRQLVLLLQQNKLLPLFGSIADNRPWLPTTMQSSVPSLLVSNNRQLCLDGSTSSWTLMKGLLQLSEPSETFTPIKPDNRCCCCFPCFWMWEEYGWLMREVTCTYPLTNKSSTSNCCVVIVGWWLLFVFFVIFLLTICTPPVKTVRWYLIEGVNLQMYSY